MLIEKSLNEDVCNLAFIPFVNAEFNVFCEDVNEFKEVISVCDELINPNADICADELIVPFGMELALYDDVYNSNASNRKSVERDTIFIIASSNTSNVTL
jgi:hypothetical protein